MIHFCTNISNGEYFQEIQRKKYEPMILQALKYKFKYKVQKKNVIDMQNTGNIGPISCL